MFRYLGIDIGGKSNTWAVAITGNKKGVQVERALSLKSFEKPASTSLAEIEHFVKNNRVLICAVDAPLSFSLDNETGLRTADRALRHFLPKKARNWVVSFNSLMGIPIRAKLLAEAVSPYTCLIETHPRASLLFTLPEDKKEIAFTYKTALKEPEEMVIKTILSRLRVSQLRDIKLNEGVIDALFCAVTAWFYAYSPEKLIFLPPEKQRTVGFGPFVIISPCIKLGF